MRALTFDRFGGPEVLELRELPEPEVPEGHALVRLAFAGLNFADVQRRKGRYHLAGRPPWVLGYEGAGTVERLGAGTQGAGLQPGDRVGFADSPFANAELAAVPVDRLIPVPAGVGLDVAAAVLLQGLTAQYLVEDSFRLREGQTALVHAAAGGVGLLLCQLARRAGARVFAVASTQEKREAALQAGAHSALAQEGWAAELRRRVPGGVDVVYDSVGSTLPDSLASARTGGTVVFFGFAAGPPAPIDPLVLMDRSLTVTGGDLWNVLTDGPARRARAARLFAAVEAGALRVRIAATVPLAQGAEAHRLIESRGAIGKILLRVG